MLSARDVARAGMVVCEAACVMKPQAKMIPKQEIKTMYTPLHIASMLLCVHSMNTFQDFGTVGKDWKR